VTLTDIQVHAGTPDEVMAWWSGENRVGWPAVGTTTCVWLTLKDKAVLQAECLQDAPGALVVVLFQTGLSDAPDGVFPWLSRYLLAASHRRQPVHLVLAGGRVSCNQAVWQAYLTLSTPGHPPVRRLLVFILLATVVAGKGLLSTVARGLLALWRRKWTR